MFASGAMTGAARGRLSWVLGALLALNVAVSHLDLLQSKFSRFAVLSDDKDRLTRLTWPVPKLFGVKMPE